MLVSNLITAIISAGSLWAELLAAVFRLAIPSFVFIGMDHANEPT